MGVMSVRAPVEGAFEMKHRRRLKQSAEGKREDKARAEVLRWVKGLK